MFSRKIDTLDRFLEEIHREYVNARIPISMSSDIDRGRSRAISGIAEDLFAEFMKTVLNNSSLHYFVDQPIRIPGKTFYPDLVIAKTIDNMNYEVVYMLDLKMDVGYHRNTVKAQAEKTTYLDKALELSSLCEQFKKAKQGEGIKGSTKKAKVDKTADRYIFSISKKAKYDMVVITDKNAGSKKLSEQLLDFSNNPKKNIWLLDTGDHPNEYFEPKFNPNIDDFNVLISRIENVIK